MILQISNDPATNYLRQVEIKKLVRDVENSLLRAYLEIQVYKRITQEYLDFDMDTGEEITLTREIKV